MTYIRWVLPSSDFIPSLNQIGRKIPKLCTFFTFRLVGWLGSRPVWPVSMLKSLQIKYICFVLPFRDYIPSFNQIDWKMPKLCSFFTFRLVGWLDGRPVWLVSTLKSLQMKCIRRVPPFRDYIPSFNQIGWKMPKLCKFFTFRPVGWLGGRPVWPVGMLKCILSTYTYWVIPFRDSILNFN